MENTGMSRQSQKSAGVHIPADSNKERHINLRIDIGIQMRRQVMKHKNVIVSILILGEMSDSDEGNLHYC